MCCSGIIFFLFKRSRNFFLKCSRNKALGFLSLSVSHFFYILYSLLFLVLIIQGRTMNWYTCNSHNYMLCGSLMDIRINWQPCIISYIHINLQVNDIFQTKKLNYLYFFFLNFSQLGLYICDVSLHWFCSWVKFIVTLTYNAYFGFFSCSVNIKSYIEQVSNIFCWLMSFHFGLPFF